MHLGMVSVSDQCRQTSDLDQRLSFQETVAREASQLDPRHLPLAPGSYSRAEIHMHHNRELEAQEEQYWARLKATKHAKQHVTDDLDQFMMRPPSLHQQQQQREEEHKVDQDSQTSSQSWRSTISMPGSPTMKLSIAPHSPTVGTAVPSQEGVVLVHACMDNQRAQGMLFKHQSLV